MPILKAGALAAALGLLTPYGYADDDAPPPPVRPVTPGTRVDDAVAPVTLDDRTLAAIREIVRTSIIAAQASNPVPTAQAPTPSPQAPAPAPAPAPTPTPQTVQVPVYQQPVQYQSPVSPVLVMKPAHWHKQALGRLGARLSTWGQPTVTQGVIQTQVQTVQSVQLVQQQAIPVAQQVVPVVQQAVWSPSPLAVPQAPRK